MQSEQDNRAIQEELRKLRQELDTTKKQVADLNVNQLRYPVDANSQSVFNALFDIRLKSILMDTLWKRVYRWYEPWDSFGATDNNGDPASAWVGSALTHLGEPPEMGALVLETDAVTNDLAFAARLLNNFNTANTFDRNSYFRLSLYFKTNPTDHEVSYFTVGDHLTGERNFYGFKVYNGKLYGVISSSGVAGEILTKPLVTVKDFDADLESYLLEARYYAGQKVDFFVTVNPQGLPAKQPTVPLATIRSPINIPALVKFETPYMFSFSLRTLENDAKLVHLLDFDYIEQLDVP